MKAVVLFQSLSKFGMFTFVVSYAVCFIVFFSLTGGGNKIVGFLVRWQKVENFKEILIKKVFHLTHNENSEETKEVLGKLIIVKNDAELAECDGSIMA